jgi:hypothetical protein
MTSAEKIIGAAAARLRGSAPYGIPGEALAAYDRGQALQAALKGSSATGFEVEVSQEVQRHLQESGVRLQGGPHSVVLPGAVFFGQLGVGVAGGGQELVRPVAPGPRTAPPLRPTPRVVELGATVVSGAGGLRLVRLDTGFPLSWVASDVLEDDFDLADLTTGGETAAVRTGMTGTIFSRLLRQQTDVSALLQADVDRAVAALVDQAAVAGSGADGEPLGLFNRSMTLGPGLGTDGGPVTWDALTEIEALADENALRPGWLTTKGVRRELRRIPEVGEGGGPIWRGGPAPGFVLGSPAFTSGHVPSDGTKGAGENLHGLIYGSDWSQLLVNVSAVELVLDPYVLGGRGLVVARIYAYLAVGVWHSDVFVRTAEVAIPGEAS